MTPEQAQGLRAGFPPEQIGLLPRVTCGDCSDRSKTCTKHKKERCSACGGWLSTAHIHLDYAGHGAVTSRLLEVDPEWNWEPVAADAQGFPVFDTDGKGDYVGLWIKLTVGGVTRLGYGSVPPGTQDAAKQLIGDALRNAAMRFGVALDLWIKGHVPEDDERNVPDGPRASGRARQEEDPLVTDDMVQRFYLTAATAGFDEKDVREMVLTFSETSAPEKLHMSEWPRLRDEFRKAKAAKESASPVTPQGEGSPAPAPEGEASTEGARAGSEGDPPAPTEPEPQPAGGRGRARIGSKASEGGS